MIEIDKVSESNLTAIIHATESLRQIIDKHEKRVMQQIEENKTKEKKLIGEYEQRLQSEQRNLNTQRVLFETLKSTKNDIKLLELRPELLDNLNKLLENLHRLEIPTTTGGRLVGLKQLPGLQESILECGRFVESETGQSPLAQKRTNSIQANSNLFFGYEPISEENMKIIIDTIRNNKVR
ncbi:unnamed protein product [Rotaria socialis]|uniref:Uncharacterized protein n=1 Tax=Rotaria socialis TaxID=392032 RepID=A0A818NUX1_9BILA|nr:unnamed protein product [Rotaria socialis]